MLLTLAPPSAQTDKSAYQSLHLTSSSSSCTGTTGYLPQHRIVFVFCTEMHAIWCCSACEARYDGGKKGEFTCVCVTCCVLWLMQSARIAYKPERTASITREDEPGVGQVTRVRPRQMSVLSVCAASGHRYRDGRTRSDGSVKTVANAHIGMADAELRAGSLSALAVVFGSQALWAKLSHPGCASHLALPTWCSPKQHGVPCDVHPLRYGRHVCVGHEADWQGRGPIRGPKLHHRYPQAYPRSKGRPRRWCLRAQKQV